MLNYAAFHSFAACQVIYYHIRLIDFLGTDKRWWQQRLIADVCSGHSSIWRSIGCSCWVEYRLQSLLANRTRQMERAPATVRTSCDECCWLLPSDARRSVCSVGLTSLSADSQTTSRWNARWDEVRWIQRLLYYRRTRRCTAGSTNRVRRIGYSTTITSMSTLYQSRCHRRARDGACWHRPHEKFMTLKKNCDNLFGKEYAVISSHCQFFKANQAATRWRLSFEFITYVLEGEKTVKRVGTINRLSVSQYLRNIDVGIRLVR